MVSEDSQHLRWLPMVHRLHDLRDLDETGHREVPTENEEVDDLAGIVIRTLSALRRACGDPDFNLVMYSAPTNGGHAEDVFHWHLKLIPRIATQAGFEIGSGFHINPTPPEDAAQYLREVAVEA